MTEQSITPREIKFQDVHRHFRTGKIAFHNWGPVGGGFIGPAQMHGYEWIAHRQFTGLKDKNGKEIYEGDLLRYPADTDWNKENFTAYEVFFHDGDANSDYNIGFSISRAHHQGAIAGNIIPSFKPKTTKQMEVCGNIYETTELISSPLNQ